MMPHEYRTNKRTTPPARPDTKTVVDYQVHKSHHFIPADDVLECSDCTVRPYNDGAKLPCPEDTGHGGPE